MTIYFDMDGTLADLYNVDGWLEKLRSFDSQPYEEAEPLCDLSYLARLLNFLQKNGHDIGIISWLSKDATAEYDKAVRISKKRWLAKHLPSVVWDEIHLVKYGTPKHFCCQDNSGILFDDNEDVRRLWDKRGKSFSENDIIEVLKELL
ncbi:hypothetical protein IJD44_00785 [bacterium]|nr:hypothetical protein [bacterium]